MSLIRSRKALSLLMTVVMSMATCVSCKKTDDEFPELSYPDQSSAVSEVTADEDELSEPINELLVAVPYSSETVELLAKLYYAKQNDLIEDSANGRDISLDYLDSIEIPWVIRTRQTSGDGAGLASILQWQEDGDMPDLMLVEDIGSVKDSGLICPYDDYLSMESQIDGNLIYPDALIECMFDDGTYGLPHYQSVMLLVGNSEYIPESGRLPFRSDTDGFLDYLRDIRAEGLDEEMVVFAGAYELLPYLTSAFDSDTPTSYMFSEDQDLSGELDSAVDYVGTIYDEGLSAFSDQSGADPRISRSACMWLSSSGSIDMWSVYYPDSLYFAMLPSDDAESSGIPYSTVYSMCMSSSCTNKEFASGFAEFMCFDTDALMLLNRVEPQRGYLPCVTSSAVWDIVCEDEIFGTEAMLFEQILGRSIYCPGPGSAFGTSVNNYNRDYYIARSEGSDPEYDLESCLS